MEIPLNLSCSHLESLQARPVSCMLIQCLLLMKMAVSNFISFEPFDYQHSHIQIGKKESSKYNCNSQPWLFNNTPAVSVRIQTKSTQASLKSPVWRDLRGVVWRKKKMQMILFSQMLLGYIHKYLEIGKW